VETLEVPLRQRGPLDRLVAHGHARHAARLVADVLRDLARDPLLEQLGVVTQRVRVGVEMPRDEAFPEAPHGAHDHPVRTAAHGVGGEEHAKRPGSQASR
jgi:hypothetical protein